MSANPYETDLPITVANYQALSPLSFLAKAAWTYPDYTSVIDGGRRFTWAETLYPLGLRFGETGHWQG